MTDMFSETAHVSVFSLPLTEWGEKFKISVTAVYRAGMGGGRGRDEVGWFGVGKGW